MKAVKLIIALFLLVKLPVSSQDSTGIKKVSWELSYSKGFSFGGPSTYFQSAGRDFSQHTKNFSPDIISIEKNIYKSLGVGIIGGKINQNLEPTGAEFNTVFIGPSVRLNYKSFISFEAGPSFNFVRFYHIVAHVGPGFWLIDDKRYLPVGIFIKSALEFPVNTTFLFKAEIQYLNQGLIKPLLSEQTGFNQYIIINSNRVNLYSWYVGAGFGIRFFDMSTHKNTPDEEIIKENKSFHLTHFEIGVGVEQNSYSLYNRELLPTIKMRYGKNFQIGTTISFPPRSSEIYRTLGLELYYHFAGKSRMTDQDILYFMLRTNVPFQDKIFVTPKLGGTINGSRKVGLNLDIGPAWYFTLKPNEFDFRMIKHISFGASFFIRL